MNVDHGIRRQRFHERPFEEGYHRGQWKRVLRGWKVFSALVTLCLSAAAIAQEPATWRVWLEPRFMRQPVTAPIAGAEKTEMAGGYLDLGTLEPWRKEAWTRMGVTWEKFSEQARANAAAELATLQPTYVRNRKKIIEYAEFRSPAGTVAAAVLAPSFRALFEETLGPDILLVVPNRTTAYVFPKLVSNYQDYSPMVLRAFGETSHPVSLEVFEVTPKGMRAIGAYADPRRDRVR